MTKQILMQAATASMILAVVGVSGNMVMKERSLTIQPRTVSVAAPSAPTDLQVLSGDEARERAREEHGEPVLIAPSRGIHPLTAAEDFDPWYADEERIERHRIILERVDVINTRLEEPNVPPDEREQLEQERFELLMTHYNGEAELQATPVPPPIEAVKAVEAQQQEESTFTLNNMFNKVWGLLQALIVAWAVDALRRKKNG
jgi:hypothetical protein